ncbi:ribosome-associated translation inhibitor RaiA [Actinoallomurus purpureus]|uniref:ribosome hibernation-promoting factor, HPF/YfiA family n=1 Tax=Actinoallomurus purpureus TaxID=478114 RepID=UPI0020929BD1|nr:ribosome-associated translation inhibitor RaiA [Actinoallomurus purpureus]MCO6004876.1 ribosome-associated translation inhibitor RaiA [Actinoallomurus purpureus]
MEIIVKGRHTDVSDRFRRHVDTKISKVEKLDPKVMRIDVEVSQERNPRQSDRRERVELTIHSRGPVIRAEAAADDRFAALDMAIGKLESRLRRVSDRRKPHGGHGRDRLAMALAPDTVGAAATADTEVDDTPSAWREVADRPEAEQGIVPIPMEGDGPLVVREKSHKAQPMTIDQALFEMELVGHDFFLFRDKDSGDASVVYRRCGWDYGVIRLLEE